MNFSHGWIWEALLSSGAAADVREIQVGVNTVIDLCQVALGERRDLQEPQLHLLNALQSACEDEAVCLASGTSSVLGEAEPLPSSTSRATELHSDNDTIHSLVPS